MEFTDWLFTSVQIHIVKCLTSHVFNAENSNMIMSPYSDASDVKSFIVPRLSKFGYQRGNKLPRLKLISEAMYVDN